MHTPFFPAFRARLAPLGRRVQHLRQQSLCHLELLLGPFLPPGLLAQEEEGPNSRERVFSVRRTFFGFLYQVLKPDTSCREIVRQIQALFGLHDQGPVDENTSAFCQARKRLPLDRLCRVRVGVAAAGEKMAELWHGLRPGMLHKELEMFFIAYNLIRCLIVQAGAINDVALDRMSFKGTVDSVRQFSLAIAQARSKNKQHQLIIELLEVIARDQVPDRPDRLEPRAVKRRPKAYQLLNRPRQVMKEIPHRSKYRKTS